MQPLIGSLLVGFNTQPPEGGCLHSSLLCRCYMVFQHTATRRWLRILQQVFNVDIRVSTHSHPKVAADKDPEMIIAVLGFNTQPPEGGCKVKAHIFLGDYSFNTQPPEGGCQVLKTVHKSLFVFQHTATRRWLQICAAESWALVTVSTHSHPKVAAK